MGRTLIAAVALAASPCLAGPIIPPLGPVGPTYKTLHEVEPRTPISQADIPLQLLFGGSYYLTEDLVPVGLPDAYVIQIAADNTTLDLRGFTIYGHTEVTQAFDCIQIDVGVDHVTIMNGFLDGAVADGISGITNNFVRVENIHSQNHVDAGIELGDNAVVVDCIVSNNGGAGLDLSDHCAVERVTAYDNGGSGFRSSTGCTFRSCTAFLNDFHGFQTFNGSTLDGCTSSSNGMKGFAGTNWNVFTACVSRSNTDDGFGLSNGNVFIGCQANSNDMHGFDCFTNSLFDGCSATNNDQDGFESGIRSSATGCTALTNQGAGFDFDDKSTLTTCTAVNNANEGFIVGVRSSVTGCASRNNLVGVNLGDYSLLQDSTASFNDGAGVVGFNGLRIINNYLEGNGTQLNNDGVLIGVNGTDNHIEANTAINNSGDGFDVNGPGNLIIRNKAWGNGTNYSINGGNNVGTIVNTPAGAGAWDNFTF